MFFELLVLLASLIAYACYRIKHKQSNYWQNLGVKCPRGKFPMGSHPITCNDVMLGKVPINNVFLEQYLLMKDEKMYGIYQLAKPFLVLRDPDLIKQILVKDFSHFVDRNGDSDDFFTPQKYMRISKLREDKIWGNMLITSSGDYWKNARSVFTPIFTSGKMKAMVGFLEQVNERLMSSFEDAVKNGGEVELKEHFGKFTMDTISLCAFGMDAQSFTNPDSIFVKNAKNIFKRSAMDRAKIVFAAFIPGGRTVMQLFQIPILKANETRFFDQVLQTTLRERKKHNIKHNDLIDMMLEAMKEETTTTITTTTLPHLHEKELDSEDEDKRFTHKVDKKDLDEITIVATAMNILVAGYDTTAQTLSYAAYELAMNPEVQKRLQEEIDEAMEESEGKLPDYSKIQSMQYLDMVFHETLRLHPLISNLRRACVNEYTIPGTNIKVHKGDEVFINVSGIHSDPQYYPEPEKFDPERFSKEGKAARHPYAFLGFGQGPRSCIGMRFAMLEGKIVLISLLSKYTIVKSKKTVPKIQVDPSAILGLSLCGLYVTLVPRN